MTNECAPQLGEKVLAFFKPKRAIDRVFIHCSATSNTDTKAEDIHRWHTQDNGWHCIGYHYFIRSDGFLEYGRTLERDPAAQSGHNAATIAICLNGLHDSDFTQVQFDRLNWLADQIDAELPDVTYHGHNEVAAKGCPVFDYRAVLGLDEFGVRAKVEPPTEEPFDFENLPENWQAQEAKKRLAEAIFWAKESRKSA